MGYCFDDSLPCAGSGDINNGNEKLILGLIWTLIQHYQISIGFGIDDCEQEGKGSGKTGKQALLEWLQVSQASKVYPASSLAGYRMRFKC